MTWIQEAIDIYSKEYQVSNVRTDVNAWRYLCRLVLDHVKEQDLTYVPGMMEEDKAIFRQLETLKQNCENISRICDLLAVLTPPKDYLWDYDAEEESTIYLDVLHKLRTQEYEKLWKTQIKEVSDGCDQNS